MSKETEPMLHRFLEEVSPRGNLTREGMGVVKIAPRRGVPRPRMCKVLSAIAVISLLLHPKIVLAQQPDDPEIVTFDVPGAGKTPSAEGCGNFLLTSCFGTTPMANNNAGYIVGMYITDSGVYYGFLRSPDGKVTILSEPNADTTPGDFNGTYPFSINSWGAVTGGGTPPLLHSSERL
jgi:hypothetical protein